MRALMKGAALLAGTAILAVYGCPAKAQERVPGGAHAELVAGMTLYDSTVTVGGTELVDQGGDAPMAGARAGYGWAVGMLYLGVEAEALFLTGRSRAVVQGHAYSYSPSTVVGGYGRVGWIRPGGSMLYARAGAQLWDGQGVPAVGAGMEIPFGRFYARLDISYAWGDVERYQGTASLGFRF